MKLKLSRIWANKEETLGMLSINEKEECFILEDQHQDVKVYGETRIPQGTYKIILRTVGGKHEDYSKRFDFHKGMLWLQDVPGFTFVYIHIGNSDLDSLGCLLTGRKSKVKDGKIKVEQSTAAYESLYKKVLPHIDNLYIEIT